jgi:hypothetical protein
LIHASWTKAKARRLRHVVHILGRQSPDQPDFRGCMSLKAKFLSLVIALAA